LDQRPRAFSLVEMVMVLTIISLAAAIAVPRFTHAVNRRTADSAARRIVQDLALARQHARVTSSDISVNFRNTPGYEIKNLPDPNNPNESYTVDLKGAPYNVSQWEVDFAGAREVSFDMYARPSRRGTIVLRIGGESRTITLNRESGVASFQVGELQEAAASNGFEVEAFSK